MIKCKKMNAITKKNTSAQIVKTGNSGKVGQKYQITIPKELRKEWPVKPGDTIIFEKEGIGLRIETWEEYQKKYFGMFKGMGHSVKDIKEARKTMWLR